MILIDKTFIKCNLPNVQNFMIRLVWVVQHCHKLLTFTILNLHYPHKNLFWHFVICLANKLCTFQKADIMLNTKWKLTWEPSALLLWRFYDVLFTFAIGTFVLWRNFIQSESPNLNSSVNSLKLRKRFRIQRMTSFKGASVIMIINSVNIYEINT